MFEQELPLAVNEEALSADGRGNNKPFEFSIEECKGYVFKDVGFVLSHKIDWKLLDIDYKQKIKNVWVLSNISDWTEEHLGTYTNLKEAKRQLKLQLTKPHEIAIKDEDNKKLPNGICKKTDFGYSCSYFYWRKTSYEYDEWDISSNTNILRKKDVNR